MHKYKREIEWEYTEIKHWIESVFVEQLFFLEEQAAGWSHASEWKCEDEERQKEEDE